MFYICTIRISGGTIIQFLVQQDDIGRPNKNKKWSDSLTRKLQKWQNREGQLNSDLTSVELFVLRKATDAQNLPQLGGTQSSSLKKILELLPKQLSLPIFLH